MASMRNSRFFETTSIVDHEKVVTSTINNIEILPIELESGKKTNEIGCQSLPSSPKRWKSNILKILYEKFGVEEYGIDRYPNHERIRGTLRPFLQVLAIWVSASGGLTSMSSFFLGPIVYGLSLKNSLIAGILGCTLGTFIPAYTATMGPRSGLRQLTISRFLFGWWFNKFIALISGIGNLGWSVVSCVLGGQILSAISEGKVSIEIGIFLVCIISLIIAIFGINQLIQFEAWLSIPILVSIMLLYVCPGSSITSNLAINYRPPSETYLTVAGNWVSFFCLSYSVTATWGSCASDYYILMSAQTNRMKIFIITFLGILLPTIFVAVIGVYLGNYTNSSEEWYSSYEEYGLGGILSSAFKPWAGGGKFLLVILYLSLVANTATMSYSVAFIFQVFSHLFDKVPRIVWSFLISMIYLVISLVGKSHLSTIIGNFVPMLGYWVSIYIAILLEENFIFRNKHFFPILKDDSDEYIEDETYDWVIWNNRVDLTHGYAATMAFIVGAVGAILGMCQVYYVGVIARQIGDYGCDLGIFLCFAFSGLSYPFMRLVELKKFKK